MGFINMFMKKDFKITATLFYLAGSNAHKAIEDVIEDSGIIRCDYLNHIHTIRLHSLLALVNGCCKNRQLEEGFPHTWPLRTYASEYKPDWPFASRVVLKMKNCIRLHFQNICDY
jgi:hypothetical protein